MLANIPAIQNAARRYSAERLTRVDDHTVECQPRQINYIPIPPGTTLNHTGLLTVDLPPGSARSAAMICVEHRGVVPSVEGYPRRPSRLPDNPTLHWTGPAERSL